jgi:hypothetical protein
VVRRLPAIVLALAVFTCVLVAVGLLITPTALTGQGLLAVAGVVLAQAACVVASRFGPVAAGTAPSAAVTVGVVIGLVVGGLYGLEGLAEYLTPAVTDVDVDVGYGIVAALVVSHCLAGWLGVRRCRTWRAGLLAALWNAIAEYLTWYPMVLICYYAFRVTAAAQRVLTAEGDLTDFQRSGMTDVNAFVLQDFFGAGLFHLLAAVLLAMIFGSAAAGLARATRRTARTGHPETQIRA